MPKNKAALKLPDPLLVRLYREGILDEVARVETEKTTRDITVKLRAGRLLRFLYIKDLGWILDPAQASQKRRSSPS
jgi:hypothetical protein